ncbi:hypothetical protein DEU56DRAFT_982781 [Suillus clintonianus]|uniref:uncharacterized protein n=1 Tax=Suillus clintonianus TaxID=1904413 RepID=UPI001B86761C|nr:uncharacterized protein DEU56DRAFT_982781 [Suillus clintonianus]KAG2127107.1 hypothetical protein DEU56DRAFT_982781 [Suillus clintonianus]
MSSSAQDAIPQLDLGNTFGALFIGVVLSAVLFGLTNIQAFIYLQTHRSAGITFFKLFVIWLWIFDALHLALITHSVYYYLVTNYANFGVLTEIVWSLKLQLAIGIFIIPMVHLLYVHRIWKVSKGRSRVLPTVALVIVVVLSSGVAIPLIWAQYKVKLFKDLIEMQWSIFLSLGAATFVDILIASSLWYLLATSRTGFSSTDSFITKLVNYTISTGCLTSICSTSIIITCAVMPTNFIFIGLQFLVTNLYVNSFIALLNARHYMQANTIVDSHELNGRHVVYRPELPISASQDEELQPSQKDSQDGVLHITRPIQASMPQSPTSGMEMKSCSLV